MSPLLVSRLNGQQIFVFSRRLERNGKFAGAAILSFDVLLLAEVWASDAVRELRRKYLTREPGSACASCAWHRTRYAAEMPQRAPELAVNDPLAW